MRVWLMPRCIRPVACRQDFLFNWRHKKTITSVGMRKAAGAQWGELSGGSGARRLKSGLCHVGRVTLGKSLPCGSLSCHLAMMSRLDHSWLPPSLMRKAPAPNFPREPTKSRFPVPFSSLTQNLRGKRPVNHCVLTVTRQDPHHGVPKCRHGVWHTGSISRPHR